MADKRSEDEAFIAIDGAVRSGDHRLGAELYEPESKRRLTVVTREGASNQLILAILRLP